MIKYKTLQGNKTLVIEDGKFMLFGSNGALESENPPILPNYMSNLLDANMVSVLMSGTSMEIATFMPDGSKKIYQKERTPLIMKKFLDFGSMIRVLQRNGKECNISYNQMIFIYQKDIDVNWIVEEILKTC